MGLGPGAAGVYECRHSAGYGQHHEPFHDQRGLWDTHTNVDSHVYASPNFHTDSDVDTDGHRHRYGDSHSDDDVHAFGRGNTDAHQYAALRSDTHEHADRHRDRYTDADIHSDADAGRRYLGLP